MVIIVNIMTIITFGVPKFVLIIITTVVTIVITARTAITARFFFFTTITVTSIIVFILGLFNRGRLLHKVSSDILADSLGWLSIWLHIGGTLNICEVKDIVGNFLS